jgi:hypothetical protein
MGAQSDAPSPTPLRSTGRLWGYAAVGLQLALVLLIVRRYDVAARNHFFPVLCVAVGGFAVHTCLPSRLRLAFFGLLSLAVLVVVLGWPNGARVIGVGAGLIALCYVPLPFAARAALVALAGLVLVFLRIDFDLPFWPVLGSMFMFRLIVYLYELRRDPRPPLGLTVAYFFPLPNVSFLFFPILDFRTFRETYRPGAGWQAAQTGIEFLARGLTHLLLYRVVKYYVLPSPHELGGLPHLALFLASNYALYLHVSAYFHIITGVLHLFGFALPTTHHHYFLASSPTDIWRRINIPWKEFMAKVFFFPAFFAARGLGTRAAIAVAGLWVFLVTWVLHAYQVFWLTGALPLNPSEAGLWLAVGVLVAWNLQRDLARAGEPTAPVSALTLAVRVVGMFALVSLFWACWNTPAVVPFLRVQLTRPPDPAGLAVVAAVLLGAVALGAAAKVAHDRLTRRGVLPLRASPAVSAGGHAAVLAAVAALGFPQAAGLLGPEAARAVGSLRRESASPAEAAQAVRGYYEEIADTPVRAGAWLATQEGRPEPPRRVYYTDMSRPADDLIERELIPGWHGLVEGSELTINRFGMRDRPDRTREKPPGARRVALVGSSVVMGYGVGDDETFARLVEDRLNTARGPGAPRYELLNFGTGMSYAIQRHVLVDRKVWGFEPDVLFYVAHQDEFLGPAPHLAKLVAKGNALPYPCLGDVARKAGVGAATPWGEAQALLQPHTVEIVSGVYRSLAAECRRRGVLPVWVYVPMPGVAEPAGVAAEQARVAREAGFVVVDVADWADGRRAAEVEMGGNDHHANVLGHRLIADRLEALLRRRPELLEGMAK